jgi:hypothetical protein
MCEDVAAPEIASRPHAVRGKEHAMAESVYKVIALVGSSTESWEKASAAAIKIASKTLRDLRVARVVEQDVHIEAGKLTYRVKLEVSFKYEGGA